MGLLNRTQRQKLQDVLLSLPISNDSAGRDLLLEDLPPALRRTISRHTSPTIDIANIVNTADAWELPAGEDPPICVVVENAQRQASTPQAANDLQALLNALKQGGGGTSPAPAAPVTPGASGTGTLRLPDSLRLSGAQRRELLNALVSAFPSISDLRQMVSFELGQNLEQIAGLRDLNSTVFDLLTWAEAHGQMAALIQGAWNTNPGNPTLRAFVQQISAR